MGESQPHWLNEQEQRTWQAFLTVAGLLERRLGQQLEHDSGLSHLQYEILVRLSAASQGELRMSELAAAMLNSKSKLSYQIDRLEHAGLVRRRSCPSDMRAVYAVLTDAGWAALEHAAPGHVATVRKLFIDVLTPDQVAAIGAGFDAIAKGLRDEG